MNDHNGPVGWLAVVITWVSAFIGSLTQAEAAFLIAIISGVFGALSFLVRTIRDFVELQDKLKARRDKKKQNEAVDPKSE